MDRITIELRLALRNALKRPGFFAAIVVTLALGIGANTAIFTLLQGLLFQPLPYEEPERLVRLWETVQRDELEMREFSVPDFRDVQAQAKAFEHLAAHQDVTVILDDHGARARSEIVSEDYFAVLGVEPLVGRAFSAEPAVAASEVMLSYEAWQSLFGGATDVIGQPLHIDGDPRTVAGVMPRGFRGLAIGVELWTSIAAVPRETLVHRNRRWHQVVGRLRPGVTIEAADDEVAGLFARLQERNPNSNLAYGTRVIGLVEDLFGDLRQPLTLLLGAVGFVLLIACANVANLLLIRATTRRRESALRTVLGASRGAMARQFLAETLLLALAGAGLALLIAGWGVELLVAINPIPLPDFVRFEIDLPVLLFNLVIALGTAAGLAWVETWQIRRLGLAAELREGDRAGAGRQSRHSRRLLVVGEMALAMVLLIGAGLMLRSLQAMRGAATGFAAEDLTFLRIDLPGDRYGEVEASGMADRLLEEVGAMPGVEGVGLGRYTPLDDNASGIIVRIEGRPVPAEAQYPGLRVHRQVVAPGFFATLGIERVSGRDFGPQDTLEGSPVVIISQNLARQVGDEPLGQRLEYRGRSWEIVGVVEEVRHRALIAGRGAAEDPDLYFPFRQAATSNFALAIRSPLGATTLTEPLRARVESLEPRAVLYAVESIDQRLATQMAHPRFQTVLLSLFAGLALLLAAVGLISVMGFDVASRQREFGIRMALGARAAGVLTMVLREGLALVAAGTALGLALAFGLTRLLSAQLYGVSTIDAVSFGAMAIVLVVVAAAASLWPARKAAQVDPIVSLRHE
ncbi:MAG: ABC transporter permease [Acidobacteriota bacterium]